MADGMLTKVAEYLGLDPADCTPEALDRDAHALENDAAFSDAGGKVLSVRMDGDTYARLRARAAAAGEESTSALVRRLIDGHLAATKPGQPPGTTGDTTGR